MKSKLVMMCMSAIVAINLGGCSNGTDTQLSITKSSEPSKKVQEKLDNSKDIELSSDARKSKMGNDLIFGLTVEATQSQIPFLKEQYGEMYNNILIEEGPDSTIIYKYQFSKTSETIVDVDAMKLTVVKEMEPVIEEMKIIFPNIKIQVSYLNPDGSEVASFVIEQKDVENIKE